MPKTTIKNLVSLILEQINPKDRLDYLFPPDQYVYIQNIYDYPELLEKPEEAGEPEDNVRQLQPEPEMEPELQMAAEGVLSEMAKDWTSLLVKRKLNEVMRIPANMMVLSPKSLAKIPEVPKIVCLDPETNELVEGVAIGDTLLITPSGHEVLVFYNHGLEQKIDRLKKQANFCVLKDTWEDDNGREVEAEFVYKKANVRGAKYGRPVERDPQGKLAGEIEAEEDAEKKRALERRLKHIQDSNAKRYGIFVAINQMFDSPDVLNRLDSALIPETWGTPKRTERTWNKIQNQNPGGDSPNVKIDFISVRDLETVQFAINDVMELRTQLAMDQEVAEREREPSQQMVRSHGGNSYPGGLWVAGQRVADAEDFQRAGGKTRVYGLLSKAIQEGKMAVTIQSTLLLEGYTNGEEYVLSAKFSSIMFDRGKVHKGKPLFDEINVTKRKEFVDEKGRPYDPETFTVEKNTEFFINEGRKADMGLERSGFLPDLLNDLSAQIIEQVDPDEVIAEMIRIIQSADDQGDPGEFLAEQNNKHLPKKIKLTETQLKKVVNVISEENYDQALTTHRREKAREVFMSSEDAKLMGSLATNWCEGRVSHPDCEELEEVIRKLKIDRM